MDSKEFYRSPQVRYSDFKLYPEDFPLELEEFEQVVKEITEELKKKRDNYEAKSHDHEILLLGPEQIHKYLAMNKETRGKSYLLTSHKYPATMLVIEDSNPKNLKTLLKTELQKRTDPRKFFNITFGSIMFHFEIGQAPKLIRNPSDSSIALTTDQTIPGSRPLTDMEKKVIELQTGTSIGPDLPIHVIEFDTVLDRNNAVLNARLLNVKDLPFTPVTGAELFRTFEMHVSIQPGRFLMNENADISCLLDEELRKIAMDKKLINSFEKEDIPWKLRRVSPKLYIFNFDNSELGAMLTDGFSKRMEELAMNQVTCTVSLVYSEVWPIERKAYPYFKRLLKFTRHRWMDEEVKLTLRVKFFSVSDLDLNLNLKNSTQGDDFGLISIEGSNLETVRAEAEKLRYRMQPFEYDCDGGSEHMLHGIGEAFVRRAEDACEFNQDVDKLAGKVWLYKMWAIEFIVFYVDFKLIKPQLQVVGEVFSPLFNKGTLISDKDFCRIFATLDYRVEAIDEDGTVHFRGSTEQYERIVEGLDKISSLVYDITSESLKIAQSYCPICFSTELEDQDFFRQDCGHVICRDCCNQQINTMLREPVPIFKINCHMEDCNWTWSLEQIMVAVLGDSRRVKTLDARKLQPFYEGARRTVILMDPDVAACPCSNCNGLLVRSHGKRSLPCSSHCGFLHCSNCLRESHGLELCVSRAE